MTPFVESFDYLYDKDLLSDFKFNDIVISSIAYAILAVFTGHEVFFQLPQSRPGYLTAFSNNSTSFQKSKEILDIFEVQDFYPFQ